MNEITTLFVTMLAWSAGGIVALIAARYMYHFIAPFDARKELIEDRNAAVGVSKGMFLVGAGIILHGIISHGGMADSIAMDVLISMGLYALGLVLLWIGRLSLVLINPFDFNEQIHVKDNVAVGLVEGGYYVAFALVIHAAL